MLDQVVPTHGSQDPKTFLPMTLPFSDQCPMISPQLLCCVTVPSASCMPMKLVHVSNLQKHRAFHQMLTLTPVFQQNLRLGTQLPFIGVVPNMTKWSRIPVHLRKLISFANLLSHALFHFVTARASALGLPKKRESGMLRAIYRHVHTHRSIHPPCGNHPYKDPRICVQNYHISTHFFCMSIHVVVP